MAAKPIFTSEQHAIIHEAAARVFRVKFDGQAQAQAKMALALGISQQSVSNLIRGRYKPGLKVATEIAILDGRNSLLELVGPYGTMDSPESERPPPLQGVAVFANLAVCVQFFATTKHWSPWTIAAARAGYFGSADFPAPEWAVKLDYLERVLEKARKVDA